MLFLSCSMMLNHMSRLTIRLVKTSWSHWQNRSVKKTPLQRQTVFAVNLYCIELSNIEESPEGTSPARHDIKLTQRCLWWHHDQSSWWLAIMLKKRGLLTKLVRWFLHCIWSEMSVMRTGGISTNIGGPWSSKAFASSARDVASRCCKFGGNRLQLSSWSPEKFLMKWVGEMNVISGGFCFVASKKRKKQVVC